MAISKDKKSTLVADLVELLGSAKSVVYAKYQGLSVKDIQELRKNAREKGVNIKIVKNRLVKVAMKEIGVYKDTDTTGLVGQLLYAVSDSDEVAPASVLDKFAKDHELFAISGGFSGEGASLSDSDVKALAKLPSKEQLIGEVVGMLLSPVNDVTNALSGNLHALLDGVEQKATK
jgi:large subunit ribosomal protein L10